MSIRVRQGTAADAAVVAEYNIRLARETEAKELDPGTVRAGVAAALADPDRLGPYWLADDDGDVVGQLCTTAEWSDWRNGWFWWIQSVYVRADARGRGVFKLLYQHVIDEARAAGNVVGVRLYVEAHNRRARDTYESLGMVETPYHLYEFVFASTPGG